MRVLDEGVDADAGRVLGARAAADAAVVPRDDPHAALGVEQARARRTGWCPRPLHSSTVGPSASLVQASMTVPSALVTLWNRTTWNSRSRRVRSPSVVDDGWSTAVRVAEVDEDMPSSVPEPIRFLSEGARNHVQLSRRGVAGRVRARRAAGRARRRCRRARGGPIARHAAGLPATGVQVEEVLHLLPLVRAGRQWVEATRALRRACCWLSTGHRVTVRTKRERRDPGGGER